MDIRILSFFIVPENICEVRAAAHRFNTGCINILKFLKVVEDFLEISEELFFFVRFQFKARKLGEVFECFFVDRGGHI